MYVIETRIKTRSNKTIWMPYKQYRTTNGIENFQKRHQYLFDAGELRVTGNAEPRQSHTKSGKGLLRVGDILHESYGYDMTINKFYEVIALSPSGKTCTIQPIHKITIKGDAYSPYGSEVGPRPRARTASVVNLSRASASRSEPMPSRACMCGFPRIAARTRWKRRISSSLTMRITWIDMLY